jgi:hypothetical protein
MIQDHALMKVKKSFDILCNTFFKNTSLKMAKIGDRNM